jgi:hypothetical protein
MKRIINLIQRHRRDRLRTGMEPLLNKLAYCRITRFGAVMAGFQSLSLFPSVDVPSFSARQSDSEKLAGDWQFVGADLMKAIQNADTRG